ncbi:hypothetical protein QL093DRAFT_2506714 [Fusarium oxysporum]|nr:hypothetical protein QL093DRAFT_2506714 [Fusarium oxysporum]
MAEALYHLIGALVLTLVASPAAFGRQPQGQVGLGLDLMTPARESIMIIFPVIYIYRDILGYVIQCDVSRQGSWT